MLIFCVDYGHTLPLARILVLPPRHVNEHPVSTSSPPSVIPGLPLVKIVTHKEVLRTSNPNSKVESAPSSHPVTYVLSIPIQPGQASSPMSMIKIIYSRIMDWLLWLEVSISNGSHTSPITTKASKTPGDHPSIPFQSTKTVSSVLSVLTPYTTVRGPSSQAVIIIPYASISTSTSSLSSTVAVSTVHSTKGSPQLGIIPIVGIPVGLSPSSKLLLAPSVLSRDSVIPTTTSIYRASSSLMVPVNGVDPSSASATTTTSSSKAPAHPTAKPTQKPTPKKPRKKSDREKVKLILGAVFGALVLAGAIKAKYTVKLTDPIYRKGILEMGKLWSKAQDQLKRIYKDSELSENEAKRLIENERLVKIPMTEIDPIPIPDTPLGFPPGLPPGPPPGSPPPLPPGSPPSSTGSDPEAYAHEIMEDFYEQSTSSGADGSPNPPPRPPTPGTALVTFDAITGKPLKKPRRMKLLKPVDILAKIVRYNPFNGKPIPPIGPVPELDPIPAEQKPPSDESLVFSAALDADVTDPYLGVPLDVFMQTSPRRHERMVEHDARYIHGVTVQIHANAHQIHNIIGEYPVVKPWLSLGLKDVQRRADASNFAAKKSVFDARKAYDDVKGRNVDDGWADMRESYHDVKESVRTTKELLKMTQDCLRELDERGLVYPNIAFSDGVLRKRKYVICW